MTAILRWATDSVQGTDETRKTVVSKDVRRRCRQLLETIEMPAPFTMAGLRDQVSKITGRPIEVRVVKTPPGGVCGLWVSLADRDFVYVPEATSLDHRRHVELHELGHILAGHHTEPAPHADIRALVPDLDLALVERMLARSSHFDTTAEREAELLATMIECTVTDWAPEPQREGTVSEADAAILDRITRSLTW